MKKFCSLILLHATRIRFFNVFALAFYVVCFLLVLEIVQDPLILSAEKIPSYLQQLFWYRVLIFLITLFNFWLIFYPIIRLLSFYVLLLDVEVKDFLFDILLFFISLLFSIVIVCIGTVMIEWVTVLNCHLADSSGEVNLLIRLRTIILHGNEAPFYDAFFQKPKIKGLSPVQPWTSEVANQSTSTGYTNLEEAPKSPRQDTLSMPGSTVGVGGPKIDGAVVNSSAYAHQKFDGFKDTYGRGK